MGNFVREAGKRVSIIGGLFAALMLGAFAMAGAASAEPADPVADAFGDLSSKITTYGGLVVGLAVASIVILFGIKWLQRGRSKA